MRISKYIIIPMISLLSACCFAKAEVVSPSTFEPLYAQLEAAMAARDVKAFLKVLGSDFKSEDTSGNVQNAEQMLSGLPGSPIDPNKKSSTTLLSVSGQGNTAFVKQKYVMNTSKPGVDGSSKYIELISISNDTWEIVNGKWRLLKTVNQDVKFSVDGKEVSHVFHK